MALEDRVAELGLRTCVAGEGSVSYVILKWAVGGYKPHKTALCFFSQLEYEDNSSTSFNQIYIYIYNSNNIYILYIYIIYIYEKE